MTSQAIRSHWDTLRGRLIGIGMVVMQRNAQQRQKGLRMAAWFFLAASAFQVLAVISGQSDHLSLAFLEVSAAALLFYRSRPTPSGFA